MKRTILIATLILSSVSLAAVWKNTAGQKIYCYAWDSANGTPKTGAAASLSAKISGDGGAQASLTDTSATEIGDGMYCFDLAQAESNYDVFCVTFSHATDPNILLHPLIAYPEPVTRQANITQVGGSSIGTPNVAGYLPVDSVYVVGETPLAAADVTTANATALSNIYLDHLMANALTDPNNVADNSVLAKLASATAAWATFNSASHSLEAIADSIIPPPPSPDLSFTVVATTTASMVTIQVGDVAIPANFWKDCLVRVDHTDWSAGSYSRVAYSTAQSGGKVILYLSSTLPFTPSALVDKVYIEAWGLRPADLPPRGPITY